MSAQDSNWPDRITAICAAIPVIGGLIVALLARYFVTKGELRETVKNINADTDKRHLENQADLKELRCDVGEVKSMLSRLEGQLSGRYPRIEK